MTPRYSDIEKAKEYLRRRLAAEVQMEHFLDKALLRAAEEIVSLAYGYNTPPSLFSLNYDPVLSYEVDRILRKLIDDIEEYNIKLALSTEKEDDEVLLPYIHREINGATYEERIYTYTARFKTELQDFIIAGMLAGIGKGGLMEIISTSFKNPYKGTIISDREHHGASSHSRMLLLVRHTIADTWMYADMEYARKHGATGFISYRGSNYPCQLCDDNANRFHTFAEPYPPYHPRCVCYAVPVFNKME